MAPISIVFFLFSWHCASCALIVNQSSQGACLKSLATERDPGVSDRPRRDHPLWRPGRRQRWPQGRNFPWRTGLSVPRRATERSWEGKLVGGDDLAHDAEDFLRQGSAGTHRTEAVLRTTPSTASSKGHTQHAVVRQMIKAAGQRQHWRDAIVMFDDMQAEGVPPVKAAYAAALRACEKGAEWKRGTELFDNYLEEGYDLDEGVVKAAVKACCRAGRPSEAEAVLEKSLARGLVPEVSLFTAVMNACYTVGDMDLILSLGDQLRVQNLTPDEAAYHLMVTSHICKSDWVSATEALVEMGNAGLAPSARSTRQWRLASAAVEEIDIDVDEDSSDDYDGSGDPWDQEESSYLL